MSRKSVEIVRQCYESLTRGDDAWLELVAPDFVADFSGRRVDPFALRGLDDPLLATLQRQRLDVWEELPIWEPEELVESGHKVFAFIRMSSRGKASGALVEARVANVWTFRDGRPAEFTYFGEDRAAALKAAGLEE